MLRPRIIPCLLVKDGGLVKTVRFKDPRYVGDPINAVRIFNEKEVDEIIVLDIDATAQNREPNYGMIECLAAECRMPLCYGGGVTDSSQVEKIVQLGVEKVAISAAAVMNPKLLKAASSVVGSQSVVVVLDVRICKSGNKYEIWSHNGQRNSGKCPITFAHEAEALGVGEIVINSIDNDGVMEGYDLALADEIRKSTSLPLTVLGGAGSIRDIGQLINMYGTIGAAAGSIFVFKGAYKAVLINYPKPSDKDALIEKALII